MVVDSRMPHLDLAHLAFFVGLRVNELALERGRRAGYQGLRESHGFVIQHLIDSDRSITELGRRMEVSQQAASKAVAELVRLGYVERTAGRDRRQRRIRLSVRGWKAVRLGRESRQGIVKRLRRTVGARAYAGAESTLLACLTALGGVERIGSRRIRAPR